MTVLPSRVRELAEQVAADHSVEVLELALRRNGRSRVLSVVLDSDGPIDATVIERVTRDLSRTLDDYDPLPDSYTLEVTTPGLDRPLRTGRDFRRQRGHEVQILRETSGRETSGDQPRTEIRGVVVTTDEQAVTVDVGGDQLQVPLSDVVRGKVVLPW
jgi:ribosome maturation factor RimP